MAKKSEHKKDNVEYIFAENEAGVSGEAVANTELSASTETAADEINQLKRMLGAVLEYLTNDDLEELDIEYLFDHTEGLREFWQNWREHNRKEIAEEIKHALDTLPFEELERIRQQIMEYKQ